MTANLWYIFEFVFEYIWLIVIGFIVVVLVRSFLGAPKRNPAKKVSLEEVNARPKDFNGDPIPCRCPTTGQLLGHDYSATMDEIESCITKARVAQKKWAKTSFSERRAFLYDLMEAILVNQQEIAFASHLDTGKSKFELLTGEIMVSCEKIRYTIKNGEKALKPEYRQVPLLFLLGGKYARMEYYPLGVIGVIIPWNYPFHNFISPVISALFSGNAIVVKVSEWATWSRRYYQEVVHSVLIAHGHDPNLVQTIPGYSAAGAALVQSEGIDKILFIGSPQTGQKVMKAASDTLKPVILELGGKDPFIVLSPCEVEVCVDRAINGAFFNLGQNCISAERVLVDAKIFDKFASLLKQKMETMRQGVDSGSGAVDFGAMTVPAQVDKVKDLIVDAVNKGAKILWGGSQNPKFLDNKLFFQPTILTKLNKSMKVWTEELFGPVMLLIPFNTPEEAIEIANSTPFGLGSSILCKDIKKAENVAKQIDSGMCVINDYGMSYMMQDLPFGGCKKSGFGHFNGPEGLRGFCRMKSVAGEFFSPPSIFGFPRFMRRPVLDISPPILEQLMVLFYGWGVRVKMQALLEILRIILRGVQK